MIVPANELAAAGLLSDGTGCLGGASNSVVDGEERQALVDEGLDPDDSAVVAAIDLVRWELSLLFGQDG